ncbi:tyrosine-protein phosphatase non-receptor type 12-like isoform X2 [Hippocampus comes]|uniref:tyrosine-protein phosphatase non-receptor type 12-like isoform X1 n=2 Tax=Hippocampus comes TaxID=109280 RepID=UPI00094EF468|nr:PREDICTED: tyrosine-protein phosphatase non-receptor type 12-like isoform X1 [Hippocampus comes]XP_019749199.1 PREDICTED: tyrosine-protein phosphatase non-receptor type 12-like isoform X2 [Hippocampus comes]XP_019749200.1 PREDICTED: tyrosine-protein phosphatase non-receptor type 12-like isoform X2 [Hippocampus comes]
MMDQAGILRKFIQGVKAMTEGDDDRGEDNFGSDFMRLRRLSTKYRTEKIYPTNIGEREENVKKNRYKDILPFDHTRVKLTLKTTNQDTDYINANFIKGMDGPEAYIATQGPLPNTVIDFWRMNWEYNVAVIVMACREFEMGRKKCERYFPLFGEPVSFGPFRISCESEQARTDYSIRSLVAEYENETRRITQFHYINWPDHDVPSSFDSILDMIGLMREYQENDDVPICVHCSAGCGRTGAICAIDYTWNLLKAGKIPEDFNVFRLIQEMRTQRHSAVQTKEQYELVHRAIAQLFQKQLQLLESPTNVQIHDVMDESSPDKASHQSNDERWDTPPPKPPRIRSTQVEGDVKEEILQPPEPHPVPPILTPSPPSAFPTVTNVRQDNDRYHPKPVIHVLATAQQNVTRNDGTEKEKNLSEASPKTQTSPSEPKDQNVLCQKQQMSNLDLNENYNNKLSAATAKSESGQSLTPSLPISPAADCCAAPRIERKLSIEIKKVPLQEGPRSFDTSSAMGVAAGAGGGSANSGSMLQRCHAFKVRSGQSQLTSSSSLSEDSGTEGGCGESQADGGVLARPNHLPVKSDGGDRAELKASHAAWAQPCGSPEKPFPKTTSSDRVAPSSSSSSHLSSSSSSTPVRTALSFTNPLHSDNSDDEGDGEMSAGGEGCRTSVSTATVTALHFGDHQLLRKVSPMSIAGQSSSSPAAVTANSWDSDDSPPPLPERTPESFILATDPLDVRTPASAEGRGSHKDLSECVQKTSPADSPSPGTRAANSKADLSGVR